MRTIDDTWMLDRLTGLPRNSRIAFAASCCERMLPNYYAFSQMENWGQPELLRQALDIVWDVAGGEEIESETLHAWMQGCERQAPDLDDFETAFRSQALSAVAAILHSLECCCSDELSSASIVGREGVESVYQYLGLVNDAGAVRSADGACLEEWIMTAPLMCAEVIAQELDLDLLLARGEVDESVIHDLKASSRVGGIQPQKRGLAPPYHNPSNRSD